MPITHKPKPKLTRHLRSQRTAMRKWAKDKPPEIQVRVREIFCPVLRLIEREPLNAELPYRAAMAFMGIAAVHGHYRQWPAE